MLTLGSLFDGIGGWQIAAARADITPIWSSEIEKFPLAVTAKRFPSTEQLGDITKIDGSKITPVDIITMGSPCQNLSVAGNRKGLKGEQSILFMHGIRIIREMRKATKGQYPRFVVWETYLERSVQIRGWTLKPCLKKPQKPKFQCLEVGNGLPLEWYEAESVLLHGESWTLNTGESPNAVKESSLSQILQSSSDVPTKYYLSQKACTGILRRRGKMGKWLPKELIQALIRQSQHTI